MALPPEAQGLWGGTGGPGSWMDLRANPTMRDALLMFGASMLKNRHRGSFSEALGAGLESGMNTWAARDPYYRQRAEEERQKHAFELARQGKNPYIYTQDEAPADVFGGPMPQPQGAAPPAAGAGQGGFQQPGAPLQLQPPPASPGAPYQPPTPGPGRSPSGPTPPMSGGPVPGNMAGNLGQLPYQVASADPRFAAGGGGAPSTPFGGAPPTSGGPTPAWDRLPPATAAKMRSIALGVGMTEAQANAWTRQILQESQGLHLDPRTGKVRRGTSGEYGIGQIMPNTFKLAQKKYGIQGSIEDEDTNLETSARIAKEGFDRYGVTPAGSTYYNSPRAAAAGEWTDYTNRVWGKNTQVADVSGRIGATISEEDVNKLVQQSQESVDRANAANALSGVGQGGMPTGAGGSPYSPYTRPEGDMGKFPGRRPQQMAGGLLDEGGGTGLAAMRDPNVLRQLGMIYTYGGLPAAQQAMASIIADKPQVIGNKESGYLLVQAGGRIKQLTQGTGGKAGYRDIEKEMIAAGHTHDPGFSWWLNEETGKPELLGNEMKSDEYVMSREEAAKALKGGTVDPEAIYYGRHGMPEYLRQQGGTQRPLMPPGQKQSGIEDAKLASQLRGQALEGIDVDDRMGMFRDQIFQQMKNGNFGETGTLTSLMLPAKKFLASMGLMSSEELARISDAEAQQAEVSYLMQRVRPKATGQVSDFEDRKYIETLNSIDKTPLGNYKIMKLWQTTTARNNWVSQKVDEWLETHDDLKGFQRWLTTKDPTTNKAPRDEMPRMFLNANEMDTNTFLSQIKEGDVYLDTDGHFMVWGIDPDKQREEYE